MQGTGGIPGTPARRPHGVDERVAGILERLRREPALRSWVLSAPTGALASLGVTLDDSEIVDLLDAVEAMDERPLPVAARDVMTPDPVTIRPEESLHEAAQLLADHRISGLPVRDAQGSLVGVVSEFDLIARGGATVADVMTRDVVTARDTAPVSHVRAMLVSRRLKRVPIVDGNGRLVGLISRADLVRELAYRWTCGRCGYVVRARRAPDGCPRCGAEGSFEASPPPPAISTCPTCGKALDD